MKRREFIGASAAVAAGLTLSTNSQASAEVALEKKEAQTKKAQLKLSSQLRGYIPGGSTEEKMANMAEMGFVGVELGRDIVEKVDYYKKATADAGLAISAICYGSLGGALVSEDESKRGPAKEELKQVLEAAGALGSTGVIYVPAFNGQTKLPNIEIRKILIETLPELGEVATSAGTRLLLEPLNRKEAYFLRQLADGASIARDCDSPGVGIMGDFYHMFIEEPNDMGAFISGRDYIHHVHMASRTRVLPGQDDRSFIDGFQGLKMIGYTDFCSLECGCKGEGAVEVPKSVAFMKSQWEEA